MANEVTEKDNIKIFTNSRDALDYLVNESWDSLTKEQRKILRDYKRDFKYGSISDPRIDKILMEFGTVQKIIKISL